MNQVIDNTSALSCAIQYRNEANAMVLLELPAFEQSIVDVITPIGTTVLYEALVNGMQNAFDELVNGTKKVSKATVNY